MLKFHICESFQMALYGRGGTYCSCGFCLYNHRRRRRMAYCSTVGRMNMGGEISCPWLSSDAPCSSGNSCQKPHTLLLLHYPTLYLHFYSIRNIYRIESSRYEPVYQILGYWDCRITYKTCVLGPYNHSFIQQHLQCTWLWRCWVYLVLQVLLNVLWLWRCCWMYLALQVLLDVTGAVGAAECFLSIYSVPGTPVDPADAEWAKGIQFLFSGALVDVMGRRLGSSHLLLANVADRCGLRGASNFPWAPHPHLPLGCAGNSLACLHCPHRFSPNTLWKPPLAYVWASVGQSFVEGWRFSWLLWSCAMYLFVNNQRAPGLSFSVVHWLTS